MSLLADLLSKIKTGASSGKEPPSRLDVPPTLSKAHEVSPKVPKFNSRYMVIALVCLVFIALGAFVAIRFGSKSPSTNKVPATAPKIALTPPVAAPPTEQVNPPRITLGEPPAPEAQPPQPEPQKHKAAARKAKRGPCPPQHPAPATVIIERPAKLPLAQTHQKATAPAKIDTAARDAHLYAARAAEQIQDWKSALASYRKALEIDPGNYKILSNTAAALNNLGMFDDGARQAEKALEKKPDYVPALINAAIGNSSKGNTQKALRYFSAASALEPGNRSLVFNLGILHERAGNLDDAQAAYRQLASNGDPQALQGVGRIYELKGNKVEAVRTYRQILTMPNASPAVRKEVKKMLARVEE